MNVLDHITAQRRYADARDSVVDLDVAYSRSTNPAERDTIAAQIADLLEQAANEWDRSGFVRWLSTGTGTDADRLRHWAAHWRLYGDPEDDNRIEMGA